jgi:hypothetical protein
LLGRREETFILTHQLTFPAIVCLVAYEEGKTESHFSFRLFVRGDPVAYSFYSLSGFLFWFTVGVGVAVAVAGAVYLSGLLLLCWLLSPLIAGLLLNGATDLGFKQVNNPIH